MTGRAVSSSCMLRVNDQLGVVSLPKRTDDGCIFSIFRQISAKV